MEQVAGLTAAANAVVNAVNLEYNDWSGDAAAKTEKDPSSRYKHLKYRVSQKKRYFVEKRP